MTEVTNITLDCPTKMAASLSVKKLISVLSALRLPQTQQVRLKSRALHRKRKTPIQKWFDPANTSWAEPILKYQKDKASQPEPEPSLLHMVYRVRQHFTRPYWEKDILKELGLFEKCYNPVVLKNTPEINEKLRIINHLVHIKPITFPYGLPKDEADFKHCFLQDNGELVVKHRLETKDSEVEQEFEKVKLVEEELSNNIWKMDKTTITNETKRVLQRYALSAEYFKEKYIYKYNQDGKEHRYKGEHGINATRQDWY